ncbi:hypothetical protein ABT337_29590 [Saccharopolyspora hirsuta]|uniref:Uncharacterized protein n=1 Tax=Saccharopolyspora hirsuta TaxID=1837 RepID=A0A5M7BJ71_SACHI|nr:hypothetical protein [Saccharopolyspora hirsuta]KAA5828820.1 hypothetical protein F1721_27755 [Saccharopolyspora hirsuta]
MIGRVTNAESRSDVLSDTPVRAWILPTVIGVSGAVGTSLLIVLLGMLVPVLAAAPFYWAERRTEQQQLQGQGGETEQPAGSDD